MVPVPDVSTTVALKRDPLGSYTIIPSYGERDICVNKHRGGVLVDGYVNDIWLSPVRTYILARNVLRYTCSMIERVKHRCLEGAISARTNIVGVGWRDGFVDDIWLFPVSIFWRGHIETHIKHDRARDTQVLRGYVAKRFVKTVYP